MALLDYISVTVSRPGHMWTVGFIDDGLLDVQKNYVQARRVAVRSRDTNLNVNKTKLR